MRYQIMLRAGDAYAPASPTGLIGTVSYVSGSPRVTLTCDPPADDASGVFSSQFYRDGVPIGSPVVSSPGLMPVLTAVDIGGAPLGASNVVGLDWTISSAGNSFYSTSDQHRFVCAPITGDVTLIARVPAFVGGVEFAKAALCIRETLDADSRYAAAVRFPAAFGRGANLEYRDAPGGEAGQALRQDFVAGTVWLKLVRSGSLFTAYYGLTSNDWVLLGSVTVAMATTAYVGMVVCREDNAGSPAITAQFQQFVVSNLSLPTFIDTTVVDGSTYSYTVTHRDVSGNVTPQSAARSVFVSLGASLLTRFAGLSLVTVSDFGDNHEKRFDGIDAATGQVFSTTSPRIWGSESGPPRLQILGGGGRDADAVFSTAFGTDAGHTYFEIVRTQPYVFPNQAAYRLYPDQAWSAQGMVYHRNVYKWDSSFPTGANGQHVLIESKLDGGVAGNAKIQLSFSRFTTWRLMVEAVRDGVGATNIWGTGFVPLQNSDPVQTEFFQSGDIEQYISFGVGASDPTGAAPDFTKYLKVEFAYRAKDPSGQVFGYGPNGFVWAATAMSDTFLGALNAVGQQRFYVPGVNIHQTRTGIGFWLVFPFNHYTDFAVEGLPFRLFHCEVRDHWPGDASPHPPSAV